MKEATGELNMTVITVVAIAAVAALFTVFIWPRIKGTINSQSICSNGANYKSGAAGQPDYVECTAIQAGGKYTCKYSVENSAGTGYVTKSVTCQQK